MLAIGRIGINNLHIHECTPIALIREMVSPVD